MSSTITRKSKWIHPTQPPPPSPKILHFHRRTRRKNPKKKQLYPFHNKYKGRLESLFDQERHFHGSSSSVNQTSTAAQRRERVEEQEASGFRGAGERVEEKWRFPAEMLRAECNFSRMERQFALKKLERNRLQMEKTLRSAVHTLISVELLRRKMEGLSKGMLDRMEEEYGAIILSTANSSVASSASTSKRIDSFTDPTLAFSTRQQPSQVKSEQIKCFWVMLFGTN